MSKKMQRREFIRISALGTGGMVGLGLSAITAEAATKGEVRPNIIFILTDQQHAGMMSCAGNSDLKTPAMDYIAQNGMRFKRAYPTNPVCSPARVGLMTGRFPGYFNDKNGNQARENRGSMSIPSISVAVENTTIAAFMKKAGYEIVYGGKEHLPKPLFPTHLGFNDITNNERGELAQTAANYIRQKHDKPYFMWLNFINPHDICYYALGGKGSGLTFDNPRFPPKAHLNAARKTLLKALERPAGVSDETFLSEYCPALPANYEPQQDEPEAIMNLLQERPFRINARRNYKDEDWRLHRWAYCRLTEFVDQQVGTVLDAIRENGAEQNTLVIFSSDHGDMDSAHRMEHKTAMYEESGNVPFMAMWKGHIPAGKVDNTHLVSNGLDLLPTVCEYAGIKGEADPRGRSLRPILEGREIEWRDNLGMESQIGRMVVDNEGYKYIRYDFAGKDEEQLLDLNKEPLESEHFTNDPAYARKLARLRKAYNDLWFPEQSACARPQTVEKQSIEMQWLSSVPREDAKWKRNAGLYTTTHVRASYETNNTKA